MRQKTIEDYVELVYDLEKSKKRVHTNDGQAAGFTAIDQLLLVTILFETLYFAFFA